MGMHELPGCGNTQGIRCNPLSRSHPLVSCSTSITSGNTTATRAASGTPSGKRSRTLSVPEDWTSRSRSPGGRGRSTTCSAPVGILGSASSRSSTRRPPIPASRRWIASSPRGGTRPIAGRTPRRERAARGSPLHGQGSRRARPARALGARSRRTDHTDGPSRGRIRILETVIPATVAYREAASAQEPVHRWEPSRHGPTPSGLESMLSLVRELPLGLDDASLSISGVVKRARR
jgi:hypothetical protein